MHEETERPVRRMSARTAPKASPVVEDALVVVLHDGRPGFSTRIADVRRLDRAPLLLTADDGATLTGTANVLRSGTAYEEVRGRTRSAEKWWRRGARRGDDAVVVLDLD